MPNVKNWFAFLPTGIFIISPDNPHNISESIRTRFPEKQFVITEVPVGANNGLIHKAAWEFINSPKSSGRWP
jgi:hypothetical protein